MTQEEATHISLLAAPIYAVLIAQEREHAPGIGIQSETLNKLREHSIIQARALWLQTLDTP